MYILRPNSFVFTGISLCLKITFDNDQDAKEA